MVRKKGLGRGLDALIPQNIIETTSSDSIVNIELSKIIRREDQPRTHFEKDKIRELANSIKLSKSRSYIANTLRLLNLDELSLEHLKKGDITSSQARSLLAIDDMKKRKALLDKLLSKKTNVREIEKVSKKTDPFLLDLQNRFLEKFSTKVRIKPRRKGGSIEIEYLSNEDLERIMEILELWCLWIKL